MSARLRVAVCVLACGLAAPLVGAQAAATKPAPERLWEMYPLNQAGGGARSRPTQREQPTTTERELRTATLSETTPAGGVAGRSATIADPTAQSETDADDGGGSLTVALLLGLFAASVILLALAALPQGSLPVLGNRVGQHRTDFAVAAAVAVVALAVVYVVRVI